MSRAQVQVTPAMNLAANELMADETNNVIMLQPAFFARMFRAMLEAAPASQRHEITMILEGE